MVMAICMVQYCRGMICVVMALQVSRHVASFTVGKEKNLLWCYADLHLTDSNVECGCETWSLKSRDERRLRFFCEYDVEGNI